MSKFSAKAYAQKIQAAADKVVKEVLHEDISDFVKDKMQEVIEDKVYDSYSPLVYQRRKENDGLFAGENIIATVEGNRITVQNIAEPNDSIYDTPFRENPKGLLYEWIDNGDIWGDYAYTTSREGLTTELYERTVNNGAIEGIIRSNFKPKNLCD